MYLKCAQLLAALPIICHSTADCFTELRHGAGFSERRLREQRSANPPQVIRDDGLQRLYLLLHGEFCYISN